jgi:CheY-like chemotaxis protein/PAS domain-containing protein
MVAPNDSGTTMFSLPAIKTTGFDKTAAKNALAVGFTSMSGAALLNGVAWLAFGEDGSAGRAGFALALTSSLLAAAMTAYFTRKRSQELAAIEDYAKTIAKGDVAVALKKDEVTHPLYEQLNLIAEAQLRRVEEFHRLLEDSRIREERLYEALDGLEDEIAVFDQSGMLVSVNKAFNRYCNTAGITVGPGMMRREILKSMSVAPINEVPLDERDMWIDHQFQMRELALTRQGPIDSIQRDGRHLRFTLLETPSKNQIEITTDITESVVLLQDAERLKCEAEADSQRKNVTLERLKDNIRTPMTGVLAAAELLDATDLDQHQRGKLDMIRRSSGALLGVVQEMIDLNHAEPVAEKMIAPSPSVPPVAAQVVAETELDLDLDPHELVDVEARASRRAVLIVRSEDLLGRLTSLLQQDMVQTIALETVDLAMSLIADASGEIVKTDFVMSDDVDALKTLNDWATTVLPANRPAIIDLNRVMTEGYVPSAADAQPIAPVRPADTAAIPAEIVIRETMTAPTIRLEPRKLPPVTETLIAQDMQKLKGKKRSLDVMVVEDNDVNQIVYDQLLSKCGYHYLIVSTGEEGINTADREKPRLILMDISMPGLNGLDATRRLRSSGQNQRPVIVGMTSHMLSGDREKCLAAGMDDYCLKPTSSGPLRAQIAEWIGMGERFEQVSA